jgi:hypothetical protein
MSSVGEKYDPALGMFQLPRMLAAEHDRFRLKVIDCLTGHLQVCVVPKIVKKSYGDLDIYVLDSMKKIKSVVDAFFSKVRMSINDRCLSFEFDGYQVDIISIQDQPTADLFFGNCFGLISHPMLRVTPFSLGTTGLFLKTQLGGKFVLCVDTFKICDFLGISRTIIIDELTQEQLFVLIAKSKFFNPSEATFERKLLLREIVANFVEFCEETPISGATPPSAKDALDFFGQHDAYMAFLAEEEEQVRVELIRKEKEKKQAAVKKQLSAAITAKGIKDKEAGTLFDSFKKWISANKGVTYEDWAQTKPDVAKTFQEFSP